MEVLKDMIKNFVQGLLLITISLVMSIIMFVL